MEYGSTLFKNTGANTQESNTVMVLGIHIRLNFENESGESGIFRCDAAFQRFSFFRRRSKFQIFLKKSLYAEVCHGRTEKEGRQFAFGYFFLIKGISCFFQKLQIIFEGTENLFGEMGNDFRVVYPAGNDFQLFYAVGVVFDKKMAQLLFAVVDTRVVAVDTDRPVHRA